MILSYFIYKVMPLYLQKIKITETLIFLLIVLIVFHVIPVCAVLCCAVRYGVCAVRYGVCAVRYGTMQCVDV